MVKVEVVENFFLGKFEELKNIARKNPNKNNLGYLYIGDVFECTKEMAEYLIKTNSEGRPFVRVIEIIPKNIEKKKEKKKKTTKKTIVKE